MLAINMKKEKVLLLAQQLLHTAAPVSPPPGLFGSNFPLLDRAKTVAIIKITTGMHYQGPSYNKFERVQYLTYLGGRVKNFKS